MSDVYRERAAAAEAEAAAAAVSLARVVNLRLATFLLAIACLAVAVWHAWPALLVPAGAALLAFAVLVRAHGRLDARHRRARIQQRINEEALLRLARDWRALPPHRPVAVPAGHPYAPDLDVTGRASLLQLLDVTTTSAGAATLAGWLLAPAAPGAVRERQAAVAELTPLLDLRQELQLLGRLRSAEFPRMTAPPVPGASASADDPDPEPFLRWADEGELPGGWLAMRVWALAGPPLALVLAVLWLAHLLPLPLWFPVVTVNAAAGLLLAGRTEPMVAPVRAHQGALVAYARQLGLLASAPLRSDRLAHLRETATAGGLPADRMLRRLDTIAGFAPPPSSAQYLVLQSLFLWNVHVLAALERWRARAGRRTRAWMEALGEAEALGSLAGLAHAHPDWAFPDVDESADRVEAVGLGHPLIEPGRRVDNDVTLGPRGTVLLVTGSNMSGKSTLLRAIGTNAVLAAAGGPVCASRVRLPAVRVWTSMRLADSLEEGVSRFLAELRRLREIVRAAEAATASGGPPVCYLLDEVLQGTNTAERQVAARAILARLAGCRAVGAVSTHDLTMADDAATARLVRHVHFRETIASDGGRPAMTFDYRLRPGVATSTNALRLMELMGLR